MDKRCLSFPSHRSFPSADKAFFPEPRVWGGLPLRQPAYGLWCPSFVPVLLCLQFEAKCQSISLPPSVMSLKSMRDIPSVSDLRGHSLLVTNRSY